MKRFLLIISLSAFYLLLTTVPVHAACSCAAGYTCRYDYFSSKSMQVCSGIDANSGVCFCYPDDGTPLPTAPPIPEFPPAEPGPTASPDYAAPILPNSCSGPALDNSSRPASNPPLECNACKTELLTPACATTFTANDEVRFRSSESDFMCDSGTGNQAWLKRSWSGTAQINFSQLINGKDTPITKIPFVGKKNDPSEEKYLADYFEGTNIYRPEMDLASCQANPTAECQEKLKNILLTAGVWQKLAPVDLQDNYKREMISRAENGQLHDYQITAGGFSTTLTGMSGHEKPKREDSNSSFEYLHALKDWQAQEGGKWASLWAYVPMFSREDTEGIIKERVHTLPPQYDQVSPNNPTNLVEKVPHLARLYEVTKAINKLLVPAEKRVLASQGTSLQNQNSTVLHRTVENSLTEVNNQPTVLGESTGCPESYIQAQIENVRIDGGKIVYGLRIKRTPAGKKAYPGTIGDVAIYGPNGYHMENLWKDQEMYFDSTYAGAEAFMPTPDSLVALSTYSWNIVKDYKDCKEQLTVKAGKNSPFPTPAPAPICGIGSAPKGPNCSFENVLTDTGGDSLCCSGPTIKISATEEFTNPRYQDYQKNYGTCFGQCLSDSGCAQAPTEIEGQKCENRCDKKCDPELTHPVSRDISLSLAHPYLDQIWLQTADSLAGFMNIFKVEKDFEDLPAGTKVLYSFIPNGASGNTADPQIGDFYFPHLGGIQKAKTDILQMLNPAGGQTTTYSTGFGSLGNGTNGNAPGGSSTTLNYTLPFRNSSNSISTANKIAAIQKVMNNQNWKDKTQISQKWDYVVSEAAKNGWDPAFVLALWIEESGANGISSAWGLGCGVYANVGKDIESQLKCLFNVSYKNSSFEDFMCQYSQGENYPCVFTNNSTFPGGIKSWYDQLTK